MRYNRVILLPLRNGKDFLKQGIYPITRIIKNASLLNFQKNRFTQRCPKNEKTSHQSGEAH